MPCYQPIPAFQKQKGDRVQLLPARGRHGEPANLELPCGKCLGCQQTRATQWAERCKHHARQFRHCSFLTLTYNEKYCPHHVEPRHLQLFLKRLRKRVHTILAPLPTRKPKGSPNHAILSNPRKPISFFACAEYGEQTGRPHYHALLFNADFLGQRIGQQHGHELRINDHIAACWTDPNTHETYGNHTIGSATAGAVAGYIAKYVLKSHRFNTHHNPICDRDGVFNESWIRPPFIRVSKGIGKAWLERYHTDLQRGYITDTGRKQQIPRYYKKLLHKDLDTYKHTLMALEHYQHEYQHLNINSDKNTPERRADAQKIHEQKHNNQQRRDL